MTEDLLHIFSKHEVLLAKVGLFIPLVLMFAQRSVFCMQDASSMTQQSNGPFAMQASMPTFTSTILKQTSKSVHNAELLLYMMGKNQANMETKMIL